MKLYIVKDVWQKIIAKKAAKISPLSPYITHVFSLSDLTNWINFFLLYFPPPSELSGGLHVEFLLFWVIV